MDKNSHDNWKWVRCTLALVMALFFRGVVFPNLGRVVVDHSTVPPTRRIVRGSLDTSVAAGIAGVPLALVLFGTFRRSQVATVGWISLAVLDIFAVLK